MQTGAKTNSRYYIICKMKQRLSPVLKYTFWITTFRNWDSVIKFSSGNQWRLWLYKVKHWHKILLISMCQVMTAKCKRRGHVTLPTHSLVCSCIHSFIHSFTSYIFLHVSFTVASVHCMLICLTYPVVCDSCLIPVCLLYTLCEVCYFFIALLFFDQANIKLGILERLARFGRIKSCFHKDGTIGTVLHVAMTWSQTKSWLMAHYKRHYKYAQLTMLDEMVFIIQASHSLNLLLPESYYNPSVPMQMQLCFDFNKLKYLQWSFHQ